jgi:hypothetical protein
VSSGRGDCGARARVWRCGRRGLLFKVRVVWRACLGSVEDTATAVDFYHGKSHARGRLEVRDGADMRARGGSGTGRGACPSVNREGGKESPTQAYSS